MNKILKFYEKHKAYCILILIMSIVFGVLYYKYIFNDYVYAFSKFGDLGSDTVHSYYPMHMFFSKILHGGSVDIYSFQLGLGADIFSILSYVASPFDLIVVLFPPSYLHYGLLVGVYIKMLFTVIFAYKYFKLIFKNITTGFSCALIWTFSSYMVVWGQHYFFGTAIAFFTMFLYYLHKYCINPKGKHIKLIVVSFLFVVNSYYFFYMIGIFSGIYVLILGYIYKTDIKGILYRLIKLLLIALLSIGLASCILLPTLGNFLNSSRVPSSSSFSGLLKPYGLKNIFTYIARFFSTNSLGMPNFDDYTGSGNYYEAPLLFTSSLFFIATMYRVFCKGKQYKEKIFSILLYVGTLIFPIISFVLTFNEGAMRWTFMLSLVNILLIGEFINDVVVIKKSKDVILYTIIFVLSLTAILFIGMKLEYIKITFRILCISILFLVLYSLCICILRKSKKFKYAVLTLICIEMIVLNYPSVNDRGTEKANVFLKYYNDGTKEAYDIIKQKDPSFYRLQKSYVSKYLDDDYIQGYNGTNIYSSVNSKYLLNYYDSFNLYNKYGTVNCVEFPSDLYPINVLLGTKYLLSNAPIGDTNYKEIGKTDTKYIYEYTHALPFGYVYTHEIDKQDFDNLSLIDKSVIESKYYYVSDGTANTQVSKTFTPVLSNRFDLLSNSSIEKKYFDLKGNSVEASNGQASHTIEFHSNKGEFSIYNALEVYSDSLLGGTIEIYLDQGNGFDENNKVVQSAAAGNTSYMINLGNLMNVKGIKINFVTSSQNIQIHKLNLVSYNYDSLNENFDELKENGMKDVSYSNGILKGNVTSKQDGMLCIPIIYSSGWSAYVDGKSTPIQNINGGLLGIKVQEGSHKVKLKYNVPLLKQGVIISSISIVIFLVYSCKKSRT